MKSAIRWGIFGTGVIAHQVAADIAHAPSCSLKGVASRSIDRARDFATRFGAELSFDSYEDLAKHDGIDAIYIATPNSLHREHALLAIAAGKAVLVEKPFALNAAEARDIVDAARQAGVFCMEAMWSRFLPAAAAMKSKIEAGDLGRPTLFRAALGFPAEADPNNRFNNPALGGGALLDLGVYGVSLAQMIFGPPQTVAASAVNGPGGVDRQITALLGFDGATAEVTASHSSELSNTLEIAGDRGRIELEAPYLQAAKLRASSFSPKPHQPPSPDNPVKLILKKTGLWPIARTLARAATGRNGQTKVYGFPGNGYQFELEEVAKRVAAQETESPVMPLAASVEVMETLDRIRSAAAP